MAFNRYGDDWRAALRLGRPGYFHTNFSRPFNTRHNRYWDSRSYYNNYGYVAHAARSCAPSYFNAGWYYPHSRYSTSLLDPYYSIGAGFYDPWGSYRNTLVYRDYTRPRYTRNNFYSSTYFIDNDDYPYGDAGTAYAPSVENDTPRTTYGEPATRVGDGFAANDEWTFFDYGYQAFLEERYDEAQRFFLRAMWANEWDGVASLMFGLSAYARGDYSIAALAVRQALQTRNDLVDSPLELRSLYPDYATLEEHVNSLSTYSDSHPGDHDARLLLAYVHFSMEEPQRALPIVEELTIGQPQDATALYLHEAVKRVLTPDGNTNP